jgi:hypothetical protein
MYGIGQSGGWNQSEIGFWKSFCHFLISFFNWPFWRASITILNGKIGSDSWRTLRVTPYGMR